MFDRLADLTTRRPKRILAVTLVAFLLAVAFGGPVAGLLGGGDGSDFNDPQAESLVAAQRLDDLRGVEGSPRVVVLVRSGGTSVDEVRRAVAAEDGVARVTVMRSRDGQSTAVGALLRGDADGEKVGERLAEWVRSLGIDDRVAPNHGWRHRFSSIARVVAMPEDVRNIVQGHAGTKIADRYGETWPRRNVAPGLSEGSAQHSLSFGNSRIFLALLFARVTVNRGPMRQISRFALRRTSLNSLQPQY